MYTRSCWFWRSCGLPLVDLLGDRWGEFEPVMTASSLEAVDGSNCGLNTRESGPQDGARRIRRSRKVDEAGPTFWSDQLRAARKDIDEAVPSFFAAPPLQVCRSCVANLLGDLAKLLVAAGQVAGQPGRSNHHGERR